MCPSRLQVKLGPSFFIPNGQIGSFGGVLPLRSMVRDRRDLFDVAAAGPLAGAPGLDPRPCDGLLRSHVHPSW